MALFGLPKNEGTNDSIREAATNAINCALAMRATMTEVNGRWLGKNWPTVEMRVGIATGPMVVGSLGSQRRMEYTVVGDIVNTAARLESFDKESFVSHPFENPCRILTEETTRDLVKDKFDLEYVADADLKGKANKIKVFKIVGTASN
jgi:adenylate cyclase